MMYLKLFLQLFIAISPHIIVLADIYTAQAQTTPICCDDNDRRCRNQRPRKPLCSRMSGVRSPYGSYGPRHIPVEQLVQIGILIAQGKAKVDDYLLLGYANAVQGNFTAAQTRYSQASELAVKNQDLEGQAIAHNNLGEVSLATGNLKEAVSQITLAKDTYQRLGNGQRVSELNQRLVEINKLLQVNPSQLQIDPSRIQINPSQLQIQK